MITLQPCDTLVNINRDGKILSRIMRATLGNPYTHVSGYLGNIDGRPSAFECVRRGAIISDPEHRSGLEMAVVRFPITAVEMEKVVGEARRLASQEAAAYGWDDIPLTLWDIVLSRLRLPPRAPAKATNISYICSKGWATCFWHAGVKRFPIKKDSHPLPADFLVIPYIVGQGAMGKDITW
jgi:hypothetical protein